MRRPLGVGAAGARQIVERLQRRLIAIRADDKPDVRATVAGFHEAESVGVIPVEKAYGPEIDGHVRAAGPHEIKTTGIDGGADDAATAEFFAKRDRDDQLGPRQAIGEDAGGLGRLSRGGRGRRDRDDGPAGDKQPVHRAKQLAPAQSRSTAEASSFMMP